ncbi:amidase family protein [Saxibacter everestensis]|uniref:Amidase family protein n=1 Tax=Saxibacter everestensis TaxID=2909229 RepID=A0ABY8R0D9_9MICO|nr:amidase family protein [Brevibacteriaceae bacterium ZFBP1038]
MTAIRPIIDPEPGVWTEPADEMQIQAQPWSAQPFTLAVKANISVAGFHRSAGCRALVVRPESADAPVVAQLRRAGAVVIGMTNMHELAFGSTSNNADFGPVRHPNDSGRVAGGSSGGSAAAVARGDVPVALGTDTGGSMTIPASLCGVVGFRPSTGRWPTAGIVGLSWTRDTPGVFARTVAEIDYIDRCVVDSDELDAIRPRPRLGVPVELVENLDPATAQSFEAALQRWGGTVDLIDIELGSVLDHARAAEMPIVLWESRRLLAAVAAEALFLEPEEAFGKLVSSVQSPDVRAILEAEIAVPTTPSEYAEAQQRTALAREGYVRLLADHDLDALAFPATPAPAPRIGEDDLVEHMGEPTPTFGLYTRNTGQGSILGAPMLTLPAPVPVSGLPVGVTLQGPRFSDRRILRLAVRLEALLTEPPAHIKELHDHAPKDRKRRGLPVGHGRQATSIEE